MSKEDTSGIQQLISRRGQAFDKLHQRTFARWLNSELGEELGPNDLSNAFYDGTRLIRLVEQLSGKQAPRYHRDIKGKSFLGLVRPCSLATCYAFLTTIRYTIGKYQ